MFRFTIRDLLWLIVVVALGVGWGLAYRRAAAWEDAWQTCFQSALERLSPHVQGEPVTFDTPSGQWQVHCTTGIDLPHDDY